MPVIKQAAISAAGAPIPDAKIKYPAAIQTEVVKMLRLRPR